MNVFAPKAKASRKVNTSAASTTSSKTSNKSLDFNAVKDYRKSETKKKRKQESPPTCVFSSLYDILIYNKSLVIAVMTKKSLENQLNGHTIE